MLPTRQTDDVPHVSSMGLLVSNLPFGFFEKSVILTVGKRDECVIGVMVNGRPVKGLQEDVRSKLDAYENARMGGPCLVGKWMDLETPRLQGPQTLSKFVDNVIPIQAYGWQPLPEGKPLASQVGVYIGVAGWGPGQLSRELKFGAWKTITNVEQIKEVLAADPDTMFERANLLASSSWRNHMFKTCFTFAFKGAHWLDRITLQGVEPEERMVNDRLLEEMEKSKPNKASILVHELCALK